MKQLYAACGGITIVFITFFLPNASRAQCATCWDGSTPAIITHLVTLSPTQASNSLVSFPKFDPSIGTLSCIRFFDTVSLVATTYVRNTDTTAGHNYVFQTTVSEAVSGPTNSGPLNWLATFSSTNKSYGPVWLDKDTVPRLAGDSAMFGPDTLINNVIGAGTPPDFTPFMGVGNVDFQVGLNGGVATTLGGINYGFNIKSNTWGSFRLNYYWCPAQPLGEFSTGFTALKSGSSILLQWGGLNEQAGDNYEVEYSTDGVHFTSISRLAAYAKNPGQAAIYRFQYPVPGSNGAQVYFRIKKVEPNGKTGYSPVKPIKLDDLAAANYQIYPNPSSRHIYVEWQSLLTGSLEVTVVNTVGQQVYAGSYRFNGSNTLDFDLPANVGQGNYYLMVKDPVNHIQKSRHLVIR
ncbi:MAG TPA: choice-of-anchor E domain-containing protein [Chitinophagaceae bacterium]|nr:choice-of-anchor E domain-containing protein [Chitinophagaceae bacterium]